MEIVEKGSINDSEQKFMFEVSTSIIKFCFENSLFWEPFGMEAVLQAEYSDELIG